jgi:energy-converting hydrogenase Eha subunit A
MCAQIALLLAPVSLENSHSSARFSIVFPLIFPTPIIDLSLTGG